MSVKVGKGAIYPSEKKVTKDPKTGIALWQMTNYPANHSNLYYMKQSFTPDGKNVIILSCRSGYANLYQISLDSGDILQLTEHEEDISLLTPCLSPDGAFIYYVLGNSIMAVNRYSLEEKVIARFPNSCPNVLNVSKDGSFIVTKLNPGRPNVRGCLRRLFNALRPGRGKGSDILPAMMTFSKTVASRFFNNDPRKVISISTTGSYDIKHIVDVDQGGITILSPDNTHILIHKQEEEIWCCDISGGNMRHIYGRGTNKWLTHPNWLSNNELLVADWPNALLAIGLDGTSRVIDYFNLRHPSVSPDRKMIACDTTLPDTGLYAVNPDGSGKSVLFYPESSEQQEWNKKMPPRKLPFMPIFIRDPFGNEWEHTHQSFSPDGQKIIFNSTRGGNYSQVYIAIIQAEE